MRRRVSTKSPTTRAHKTTWATSRGRKRKTPPPPIISSGPSPWTKTKKHHGTAQPRRGSAGVKTIPRGTERRIAHITTSCRRIPISVISSKVWKNISSPTRSRSRSLKLSRSRLKLSQAQRGVEARTRRRGSHPRRTGAGTRS